MSGSCKLSVMNINFMKKINVLLFEKIIKALRKLSGRKAQNLHSDHWDNLHGKSAHIQINFQGTYVYGTILNSV